MEAAYGSVIDEESGLNEPKNAPFSHSSRANKTPHEFFGHTSQFWVADDSAYDGLHTQELRLGFIRKVYGILSMQLLVTVLVCTLFMVVDSFRMFAVQNASVLLWLSFIPAISCIFAFACFKDKYPWNFVLLAVFTMAESLSLGVICGLYSQGGAGIIILQAFVITAAIFILLTLFAFQSSIDFTPYSGILLVILVSMLVVSIFATLFGFTLRILYSWIGAILFSCFIIVDTQLIMKRMGYDDYIIACIELYLDILNLFLFVLQILTRSSTRNRN